MLWDHRPGHNRFAGIVLQEYSAAERKLIGPSAPDLPGHADRVHRRAAPLQAQRLLLPADGRGRHRLGARRHDGAVARTDRAVRTASGHVHSDCAPPARMSNCSAPGTPTWWRRRTARPTWCISAAGRFAIADAARWAARRRFSRWCGRRTAGCAPRTERGSRTPKSPRRPCRSTLFPHRPSARTSTARVCRWIFSGCGRRGRRNFSA